jgi:hypothetical protein
MKTNIDIRFDASDLPGGADAILGPAQCGKDVVKIHEFTVCNLHNIKVTITLEENDPRASKVFALLNGYGELHWVYRYEVYSEDDLQAAPLLVLGLSGDSSVFGGPAYGTTYDNSKACPKCGRGARQTSPMIIERKNLKAIEKFRIASTPYDDVLVRDVDVEPILAAGVTGALFWPVYAKTQAGELEEIRRQQLFIEHVMPPMSPKSMLDQTQVCPECRRGWYGGAMGYPSRFVYRREDLANIQDVNLTWEWFGEPPSYSEGLGFMVGRWPLPCVLVTPKVMNLLRAKTKKEAKYQGCAFTPIWIEDEKHALPYVQT